MKSLMKVGLASVLGLLTILGSAPAAQAYPEFVMNPSLNKKVVVEGHNFKATVEANADCEWSITYDGQTHTGATPAGTPFTTGFTAPDVDARTPMPVEFTCAYDSATVLEAGTRSAAIDSSESRTLEIIVIPRGAGATPPTTDNGGADLPGTGGPNLIFLIVGLFLLLLGAAAVKFARNRDEDFEAEPGQA